MYQYYDGLIIREGTEGLSTADIKQMHEAVGWTSSNQPHWQDEKYILCFQNSTWAYTVWDQDEMIAMVRVVSDRIMTATLQDLAVKKSYQGRGIGGKLVQLCLQKLPHGNWWAHTTPENYPFYQKHGFHIPSQTEEATLTFSGYRQARLDNHR